MLENMSRKLPKWVADLAPQIHELVVKYNAQERFRDMFYRSFLLNDGAGCKMPLASPGKGVIASIESKYLQLAAIHDGVLNGQGNLLPTQEEIDSDPESKESLKGYILHLYKDIEILKPEEKETVEAYFQDVEKDLAKEQENSGQSDEPADPQTFKQALQRILSVMTQNVSEQSIHNAAIVLLKPNMTAAERLEEIDKLLKLPASASSSQLGKMLDVDKAVVLKSPWWKTHRRGERERVIAERESKLRENAKRQE